jgi:5-methylcytosine-specific restriction enzyme B
VDILGININKIFSHYGDAIRNSYTDKSRPAEIAIREAKRLIDEALISGSENLSSKSSVGITNYTPVWYISIHDKRASTTPKNGVYIVLLFDAKQRGFYLSISKASGIKSGNLSPIKSGELKKDAGELRKHFQGLHSAGFGNDDMVLSVSKGLGLSYPIGSIIHKFYQRSTDGYPTLLSDIREAIGAYAKAIENGDILLPEAGDQDVGLSQAQPPQLKMKTTTRLITSLASKPFVILAGGTGTGKTKCAIEVSRKICRKQPIGESADYEVVAVGADWTDTRPLLGYENILGSSPTYTVPKALDLIIRASRNPERPFFLILDEMNLSHVERYFSDFLSIMESKKIDTEASTIKLHANKDGMPSTDGNVGGKVEQRIQWPDNLFVIGTVNIDETTHMFSPKVLDRAHVIEFKPDEAQITAGLKASWEKTAQSEANDELRKESEKGIWTEALSGMLFKENRIDKLRKSIEYLSNDRTIIEKRIMDAWRTLSKTRFSFSHRTAQETADYIFIAHRLLKENADLLGESPDLNELIDFAFLQKILPKLNGSAETLTITTEVGGKETTENLLLHLQNKFLATSDGMGQLSKCHDKLGSMKSTLDREHFVSFIQ